MVMTIFNTQNLRKFWTGFNFNFGFDVLRKNGFGLSLGFQKFGWVGVSFSLKIFFKTGFSGLGLGFGFHPWPHLFFQVKIFITALNTTRAAYAKTAQFLALVFLYFDKGSILFIYS